MKPKSARQEYTPGRTTNLQTVSSQRGITETVIEDHEESGRSSQDISYNEKNYGLEREFVSKTEVKMVIYCDFPNLNRSQDQIMKALVA